MKKSKIESADLFPHIREHKYFYLSPDEFVEKGSIAEGPLIMEMYEECDIIIVSTSYHKEITGSMAYSFVQNILSPIGNVGFIEVPGSFELPLTIKLIAERHKPKLFLALGCIVKGETKHDEYLSAAVINGLRNLSLEYKIPILNGVITTNTLQQAIDRAGKKYDKGKDLANACKQMFDMQNKLKL